MQSGQYSARWVSGFQQVYCDDQSQACTSFGKVCIEWLPLIPMAVCAATFMESVDMVSSVAEVGLLHGYVLRFLIFTVGMYEWYDSTHRGLMFNWLLPVLDPIVLRR